MNLLRRSSEKTDAYEKNCPATGKVKSQWMPVPFLKLQNGKEGRNRGRENQGERVRESGGGMEGREEEGSNREKNG